LGTKASRGEILANNMSNYTIERFFVHQASPGVPSLILSPAEGVGNDKRLNFGKGYKGPGISFA
jgi:hypothetical protein